MPVALTIAGSDPSGGAGIQSDLRTFAALGVVGLSVITALTVQNSRGVQSVHPVAPDLLAAQLNAILEDTRPDAVKIGMLGGAAQVRVVADALRRFRPPHVVLDPVLASTGGVPLLDEEGRQLLMTELLPLCDLVTPNLDEASILTGQQVDDSRTMVTTGKRLLAAGAKAVLIKGGHLADAPVDYLILPEKSTSYHSRRVTTLDTHGTGCFLSSAIAGYLARGIDLDSAISAAKALLTGALEAPVVVGQGRGYPSLSSLVKTVPDRKLHRFHTHAERIAQLQGLYVVTDSKMQPDRSAGNIVWNALMGGAKIVQLREKQLPLPQVTELAQKLSRTAEEHGALFIVNDRVDVALASEADGVHLGPDDMHPEDARRLLGPEKLIGVSTGTLDEARAAAPYASYFGVGAIFGTQTKLDAGAPVGVERIREIKAAFPHIPVVAIGGIHAGNIADVARAGADAAAVVSAVVAAPDMAAATRELARLFAEGKYLPPVTLLDTR